MNACDWLPGQKNEHGVYRPHEVYTLARDVKGWRGCPRAEVALVQTDAGWRGKTGFTFFSGNHWGSCRPITDFNPAHPTREAAIRHCADQFRAAFAKLDEPSMQREAREIIAWADGLCPAQGDLFGGLAA